MKVKDLVVGDIIVNPIDKSQYVFVGKSAHPIWPSLAAVVWITSDRKVCIDTLSYEQEVGEPCIDGITTENISRAENAIKRCDGAIGD